MDFYRSAHDQQAGRRREISVLIALHTARGIGKDADDLRRKLLPSAIELGLGGKDKEFGYGFVNIQPKCIEFVFF